MSICYIVGAGESFLPFSKKAADLIIAADGGYQTLLQNGMHPDLILGDFDSLPEGTALPEDVPHLRFPKEKDETDAYLAFSEGYRRGYRDFVLLACTGGRADHTYANYQMLHTIKRRGANALLLDDKNAIFCIENEAVELMGDIGTRVSIFAVSDTAHGVSLAGLRYSLSDGTLAADFPLGVSNEMAAERAKIEVKDGALLVMAEPTARIRHP